MGAADAKFWPAVAVPGGSALVSNSNCAAGPAVTVKALVAMAVGGTSPGGRLETSVAWSV